MKVNENFQFIFKPTVRCNLSCDYCYASSMWHTEHGTMTLDEAKNAINWMVAFAKTYDIEQLSILWHGGEPLLLGYEFLRNVLEYEANVFGQMGIKYFNRIQTNLTLYNETFDGLIARYFDNKIGFSYDYNSKTRKYIDGRNASNDVWNTALKCRDRGIAIGAICQLTIDNVNCPYELFNHFRDAQISFNLTQVFNTECNYAHENSAREDVIKCADAMCKIFDLWIADDEHVIDIGNFREMIVSLVTGTGSSCCQQPDCASLLLTIAPGGRLFSCSRYNMDEDIIGSYYKDSPENVMGRRQAFSHPSLEAKCLTCQF